MSESEISSNAALLEILKTNWPSQMRTISDDEVLYLAAEADPVEAARRLTSRVGDVGQRMDLSAALTVIAAAVTVVKVCLEIVKLYRELSKPPPDKEELQREVEKHLPDRRVMTGLNKDKISDLYDQVLGFMA